MCEALEHLIIFHQLKLFHSSDGNTTVDSKMAETDIWLRQQAGTEFLMAKGERITCSHEHLFRVYREAAMDVSVI
jgi:hypothetical protein